MFGSLIKSIAEITGQIVGETAHQISETVSAIADIPAEFAKGYEKELFEAKDETLQTPSDTSSN